ncbi:hypothetical protein ACEPAI_4971 [Sanghuangporus weigelae]
MALDPSSVGVPCAHADCNIHDFLPTKCPACTRLFCSIHYFPDDHNCDGSETTKGDVACSSRAEPQPVPLCGLRGCLAPCLESYVARDVGQDARVAATCPRCSLSFCAQHRFPDAHQCEEPVLNPPSKNEAARAILAKNFPSYDLGKKHVVKPPAELNVKTRQRSKGTELVQLMKMRQTARPGDLAAGHVDIQSRFHVQVKVDNSDVYKTFWFRKSISTGRAIDLLQQRLETSLNETWVLLKDSDDSSEVSTVITTFDKPLSEVLTDGCRLKFMHS